MPYSLGGIPTHPLMVHAVVVLVPLAVIMLLGSAFFARFRERAGIVTPLVATIALIAVPMATSSGEELEERVVETALVETHAELGESLLPWMVGVAVLAWAVWLLHHRGAVRGDDSRRHGSRPVSLLLIGVMILAVVASAGAGVQVFRIGHSGAKSVWTSDTSAPPAGEEDEEGEH